MPHLSSASKNNKDCPKNFGSQPFQEGRCSRLRSKERPAVAYLWGLRRVADADLLGPESVI